jgi:PPOX class probable F420-dependent enzyme
MPSGRAPRIGDLPAPVRAILDDARRGVMTTIGAEGSAHSVPIVYVVDGDEIVSPIDHKPKSGQVLARVKNLERDPRVTLLVDRWDEDWTKLGWVMVRGRAVVDPEVPEDFIRALEDRYPQYSELLPDEGHDALIRIRPARMTWWTWS